MIPDRIDIVERPKVVEERQLIGDWEGDSVHGQIAHLVTLVERASRFALVKRLCKKNEEVVADAMIELFAKVHTVLTITLENGGEFADHVRVSKHTGAKLYFAKPYASWQRGAIENNNGRISRFG